MARLRRLCCPQSQLGTHQDQGPCHLSDMLQAILLGWYSEQLDSQPVLSHLSGWGG